MLQNVSFQLYEEFWERRSDQQLLVTEVGGSKLTSENFVG